MGDACYSPRNAAAKAPIRVARKKVPQAAGGGEGLRSRGVGASQKPKPDFFFETMQGFE